MGFDNPHDHRKPCLFYLQSGPLTRTSLTRQARTMPKPCLVSYLSRPLSVIQASLRDEISVADDAQRDKKTGVARSWQGHPPPECE
jgi:hypothetical protein